MEVYKPITLPCLVGKTEATVMVSSEADLRDNVYGYVTSICVGCKNWSKEKIERVEEEVEVESLAWFESDAEKITGIVKGRANLLDQHLVDRWRFNGEKHELVVATCTPITGGEKFEF